MLSLALDLVDSWWTFLVVWFVVCLGVLWWIQRSIRKADPWENDEFLAEAYRRWRERK